MKKIISLIVLLLVVSVSTMAQSIRCTAYECAVGYIDGYGVVNWGDWEGCSVPISINMDEQRIRIFSKEKQDYQIVENEGERKDKNGKSFVMKCMDKNGLLCRVRLRQQVYPEGTQLYIEYNDYTWVYNIRTY